MSALCGGKYNEPRKFLVDSGAGLHVVSLRSLSKREKASIQNLDVPYKVNTANGEIIIDKFATVRVRELGITVKAMVLKDSPSVLSLGKLVDEHGFEYRWTKFKAPILISEDGKIIKCRTANFVPRITPIDSFRGAKATAGYELDGETLDGNIDISPNEPGVSSKDTSDSIRGAKAPAAMGKSRPIPRLRKEFIQDSFSSQENDEGRVAPGNAGPMETVEVRLGLCTWIA